MLVRAKEDRYNAALAAILGEEFGGSNVVSRGKLHDALALDGLIAEADGKLVGAITWNKDGDEFEIVTLNALIENRGTGTALLDHAIAHARALGARRAWLVTTNDNTRAIRFYEHRGWAQCAIHRDAVTEARKLKPSIPLTGENGIPIRDEIEFELILQP